METVRAIFRNKWVVPAHPTTLFTDRTILVTGANGGLGFAAARKFAALDAARLILGVRNLSSGEEAAAKIKKVLPSGSSCKIDVWQLDMGDYDSVVKFAEKVDEDVGREGGRLDVVVLNAGVYCGLYREGKYGWEETLQVNVLSTALLGILLVPVLKREAKKQKTTVDAGEEKPPVLEFVSSGLHYRAQITEEQVEQEGGLLEQFNSKEDFDPSRQYRVSKLLLMCVVKTIAGAISSPSSSVDIKGTNTNASITSPSQDSSSVDSPVTITTLCPGACASSLSRDLRTPLYTILKFIAALIFLRTAEQGARTFVSAATLGPVSHGGFWQNDILKEEAERLRGEKGARLKEKVWWEVKEVLGSVLGRDVVAGFVEKAGL